MANIHNGCLGRGKVLVTLLLSLIPSSIQFGDKSQLATIAMASSSSFLGVAMGEYLEVFSNSS